MVLSQKVHPIAIAIPLKQHYLFTLRFIPPDFLLGF
jgi:hypothetical protein